MRKNRIIFASLLLGSLIFAYFYGGKMPFMLINLLICLCSISFFYTLIVFYRFKFTQDIDQKMVMKGDKVSFLFNIINEDFFIYPYMKVTFFGSDTIFAKQFQTKSFSVLPKESKTFSFELECKYRGYYEVGIKTVEIEDFLGIFKFTYKVADTRFVTVYPKIIFLDLFRLRTNFMSETNSILDRKHEDLTTVSDIRKYAYGDSIKKVHWKLTAKTNNLMVKNFQNTSETSAIFILDLKSNNYDTDINYILQDKVIESAIAAIYYCLSNWIPITLVYFEKTFTSIYAKNPLDFDEIYRELSRVDFSEKVDVHDILDVYLDDNVNNTNIVIFTSNIDYELYNRLYKTKFSGNEVSIVYISPDELTRNKDEKAASILDYLPEINVNTYKVDISDDIKYVLER